MELTIKKFKRIENLIVKIPAKIRGGNSVGKSTILEAFAFCLTGKNLNGNEFKSVYDNRVDLHDAIADVTFTDNYGNTYQRIVSPTFKIDKTGIEKRTALCSTECKKNKISVNDFSEDFADFQKFGTDFLFTQKEDVQRSIFIDIFKSLMPNYDIKAEVLRKKSLVKTQKELGVTLSQKKEELKNINDVEVSEIPYVLLTAKNEFEAFSAVDNSKVVSELNKKNNEASTIYLSAKSKLSIDIIILENSILKTQSFIEGNTEKLEAEKVTTFEPKKLIEVDKIETEISRLTTELNGLEFFETVEDYARKFAANNSIVVKNGAEIKRLTNNAFVYVQEKESPCPLSGEVCKTAELYAENAEKLKFNTEISSDILKLKSENRELLTNEMIFLNSKYKRIKSELEEENATLLNAEKENSKRNEENERLGANFSGLKTVNLQVIQDNINRLSAEKILLQNGLTKKQAELFELVQPSPEKLPESASISEELIQLMESYKTAEKQQVGEIAINNNNQVNRDALTLKITELQKDLFDLDGVIIALAAQISEYFSNLKGVVSEAFKGDLLIDVELLEYVMSTDDYKDCFKITVDGKVFPYECNGALQNNAKFQILSTLQKIKGYTGITLMDNCEANTTQPINICGTNAVITFATNDNKLTIK